MWRPTCPGSNCGPSACRSRRASQFDAHSHPFVVGSCVAGEIFELENDEHVFVDLSSSSSC